MKEAIVSLVVGSFEQNNVEQVKACATLLATFTEKPDEVGSLNYTTSTAKQWEQTFIYSSQFTRLRAHHN